METIIINAAEPVWGAQVGKVKVRVHELKDCTPHPCPFHNPSDHAMKDCEMNIRMDKYALVERICEHGMGHPDPDSLAYFKRQGIEGLGIHGCDSCCWENKIDG